VALRPRLSPDVPLSRASIYSCSGCCRRCSFRGNKEGLIAYGSVLESSRESVLTPPWSVEQIAPPFGLTVLRILDLEPSRAGS